MKKVKVQYVAGNEIREVEIDNVEEWDFTGDKILMLRNEEGSVIAEFANVVAVMRVDGK